MLTSIILYGAIGYLIYWLFIRVALPFKRFRYYSASPQVQPLTKFTPIIESGLAVKKYLDDGKSLQHFFRDIAYAYPDKDYLMYQLLGHTVLVPNSYEVVDELQKLVPNKIDRDDTLDYFISASSYLGIRTVAMLKHAGDGDYAGRLGAYGKAIGLNNITRFIPVMISIFK